MKKHFILALVALFALPCLAQDAQKVRKWSLGTSLTPIFQGAPTMGVAVKRYLGGETPKSAIRLFTSYVNQSDDASGVKNDRTDLRMHLGYEWIKHEGNFSINYGVDFILNAINTDNSTPTAANKTESGIMGLKPLVGVTYRINNRLSISSELGKIVGGRNMKVTTAGVAVDHKGSVNENFTGQILMINYHF